ncbi:MULTISPECIES: DivIVA domain-containing protein [Desulfobacter]|uniref:DivIVA domain protein n=1 Tax=Desulfobacter postgatei 2ac9 TaxID=879212 RepID=I5B4L7_9BACT|nr:MULTISPECIES: DivIVA domain-containing protein [Desulfobacter]EIM64430.1 DivIVA domain protein [Desulfobacter postgatei 2ac9]MBP8829915.1 DivIVA domain-containing protein [Desulfobacter sp.]MDQ1270713.1 cell division initiation protein [Thermodesulfobacteriota bacterium]HRF89482.1 DivIVA domain-containing protein [Desulfobacter postgatei]
MGVTPLVIKQKEFSTRFRGFDVQEVDTFLEEVAREFESQETAIEQLRQENHRLNLENQGYRKREESMRNAMIQSQRVLDQMKENAEKSAQVIIANAEVEAEKILNRTHKRLSQLHSDITELKRQRIQLEMQIGSVLESHSKLLEMTKEENKAADESDAAVRFIRRA